VSGHNPGFFHGFVEEQRQRGRLIVQPRMGFSSREKMRRGLEAVRGVDAPTIGTVTLDSYTRQGQWESAREAVEAGRELNGYPIVTWSAERNRELIADLQAPDFPIQVRHGTPLPDQVFGAILEAGIDATEGGPMSYCLPYGRVPLADSLDSWSRCTRLFSTLAVAGTVPHLESFGGCMLGQLCPPALLVAITLLEGLFFVRHGMRSVSLSYAQGSNSEQDLGALLALRDLAAERLEGAEWHVVVYTFMGMFPRTPEGARTLIEESARVAARAGAERLIVKTVAEAHHIATIEENVQALTWADRAARTGDGDWNDSRISWHREVVLQQARSILDAVLGLDASLDRAIQLAFRKGYLDVPYCLHPDNRNRATSWLDHDGSIFLADPGNIPLPSRLHDTVHRPRRAVTSEDLRRMLSFNLLKYDGGRECSSAGLVSSDALDRSRTS
jgi:methylaspartate mutase epsilon subunit